MKIFIQNLKINAIIGLLPHERELPQQILVDATFGCEDFPMQVDYAKAANLIEKILIEKRFKTVEEAIIELEKSLKKAFPEILTLFLSLKKPNILHNATVGASLERFY